MLDKFEVPGDFQSFLKDLLTSESFSLPVLRTLAFHREHRVWPGLLERCVLPIIAAAPKLQNVFLSVPFMKSVLQLGLPAPVLAAEHVHLFKQFRFHIYLYNQEEWNGLLTNVEAECKHLEIYLFTCWRHCEDELPIILELLQPFLMRNRNSITFLVTDVPTILILHQNGLLDLFPRLKHLCVKEETLQARTWEQLFPGTGTTMGTVVSRFCQTFPELVSFRIEHQNSPHPRFADRFLMMLDPISAWGIPVQQGDDVTRRGLKELILRESYNRTVVETWAAMLPEIEHLVVSAVPGITDVDLSHIWRCWPTLVSLKVIFHRMNAVNFNSTICGLGTGEVKILEKKIVKQLTQTVIVPTRPSITGMTNLKELRVYVISDQDYWKKMRYPVPKVSQALAFERMENLKVHFQYIPKYWLGTGAELTVNNNFELV